MFLGIVELKVYCGCEGDYRKGKRQRYLREVQSEHGQTDLGHEMRRRKGKGEQERSCQPRVAAWAKSLV